MLLVIVLLAGCDEAVFKVKQNLNYGTLAAVEACVKRNESELVTLDIIRNQCVATHEGPFPMLPTGKAAFRPFRYFSGTIENPTQTHILTTLGIRVTFFDANSIDDEMHTVRGLWIMPGESGDFYISPAEFAREGDLSDENWRWRIAVSRGIKIDVH